MAVNAFWAVVHSLVWDGKVSTSQDIVSSLLSPGKKIITIIIIMIVIVIIIVIVIVIVIIRNFCGIVGPRPNISTQLFILIKALSGIFLPFSKIFLVQNKYFIF